MESARRDGRTGRLGAEEVVGAPEEVDGQEESAERGADDVLALERHPRRASSHVHQDLRDWGRSTSSASCERHLHELRASSLQYE